MKPGSVVVVLLMFASLVLAGCAGSQEKSDAEDAKARNAKRISAAGGFVGEAYAGSVDTNRVAAPDYDFKKAIAPDHGAPGGHSVRALHTGSHGLELVAYDPLFTAKNPTAYDTGFMALDTWDDGTQFLVCVTHFVGNGGADLVDITDPAKPKMLSHIDSGMLNSDCQFTDDGKYLFLGAYLGVPATSALGPYRNSLRSVPVAGAYDALADGVSIWDVTNRASPKFVLFSETGTYHNLFTVTIDNRYWLLQTYPTAGQQANIYEFSPEGGGKLVGKAKTPYMQHDMTVSRHPITGDWLLYTGKGSGLGIFNFNDPEHPIEIGELAPAAGSNTAKYWHEQEVIPQLVDGHALIICAGETGAGSTQPYAVIDVTDPTAPELFAQWDVPGSPSNQYPDNFYTFSPHEIYTWNGYVTSGNYHAGAWVWDVGSLERMKEPVTLGYYLPHEEPALHGAPTNPPFAFNPDVWGSYFDSRGYVITADWGSGLYILKFAATGTWTAPAPNEP